MKRLIVLSLICAVLAVPASAQKLKRWTDWSRKEAEKILNDSAWGQTQTQTNESVSGSTEAVTSTMAGRREDRNLSDAARAESGEAKGPASVKYRARFLSAKPVRQAYARIVMLLQENPSEQLVAQLAEFVERDFGDYVIVALAVEGTDKRLAGAANRFLTTATADGLRNSVYLERKDGKRLFLEEYRAPGNDGLGAKLVFPRLVDDQPFLTPETESVKLVAAFDDNIKLNLKYKVSDMLYDGKLEY